MVRGQPPDPAAFGTLIGFSLDGAERLLHPGKHTLALGLMAVMCLVGRLRGMSIPDARAEVEDALRVHRVIERLSTALPAADLTLDELRACQAELRGERSDITALADFLGATPTDARSLRHEFDTSRTFDPVLLACLVTRLHGLRPVSLIELLAVVRAVFARRYERERSERRLRMAH